MWHKYSMSKSCDTNIRCLRHVTEIFVCKILMFSLPVFMGAKMMCVSMWVMIVYSVVDNKINGAWVHSYYLPCMFFAIQRIFIFYWSKRLKSIFLVCRWSIYFFRTEWTILYWYLHCNCLHVTTILLTRCRFKYLLHEIKCYSYLFTFHTLYQTLF